MKNFNEEQDGKSQENVKEVLFNSPQDKNYLSIKTAPSSDYEYYGVNFHVFVTTTLLDKEFDVDFFEEKDENGHIFWMSYSSKGNLEVYNLIKPNVDTEEVEAIFIFKGPDDLINEYRSLLSGVVNTHNNR